MTMGMHEAGRRAIRTLIQAWIGVFLALTVSGPVGIDGVPDYTVLKRAAIAGLWAGIVAVLSWLQNELEDHGAVPKLLKD